MINFVRDEMEKNKFLNVSSDIFLDITNGSAGPKGTLFSLNNQSNSSWIAVYTLAVEVIILSSLRLIFSVPNECSKSPTRESCANRGCDVSKRGCDDV